MKILHCIAQLPMKTGSGVYFSTLVEGLLQKGWDTALLYGTQAPFSQTPFAATVPTEYTFRLKEYPVVFLQPDLPFPIAGMSDIMPYESTVYSHMNEDMYTAWLTAFESTLIKIRREYNPDIIITHHIFILSSLVKKIFFDKKVIGISHGTDIRQLKQNPWIQEKYIHYVHTLDLYCTVNPNDVDELHALFAIPKTKIQILGGGVNPSLFNDTGRHTFDGTFRLLYAGKIAESKGVFELAAALPIILQKYPHTQLTIVGNATAEQKAQLHAQAQHSPKLHLHDAVPHHEMSTLFKAHDIFILPSYYEALGLVAIEALFCGLFVVATEIEGLIALLGKKVNTSGIIAYTNMPRRYEIDKVCPEEKPAFTAALAEKIMQQMNTIAAGIDPYPSVAPLIQTHSWHGIIEKMSTFLQTLRC